MPSSQQARQTKKQGMRKQNKPELFFPGVKLKEELFPLHLGIRSSLNKRTPLPSPATSLRRRHLARRRRVSLLSRRREKGKPGPRFLWKVLRERHAPSQRATGDSAPDGAAAPRAGARTAGATGRGVTGSLPSCLSPEMHASASL